MTPTLEKLINCFASLPGVGRKSAVRLSYRIIEMKPEEVQYFAETLLEAKNSIKLCSVCQSYSDTDICPICADDTRDGSTLIVVEDNKALEAIEEAHEYRGKYHVLHGVISPVDGIGPDRLKIKELIARLDGSVKEVIIATNPSTEGEATAMYLARLLKPFHIRVSRLAYGIPVGGQLEYIDEVTLMRALDGRHNIE